MTVLIHYLDRDAVDTAIVERFADDNADPMLLAAKVKMTNGYHPTVAVPGGERLSIAGKLRRAVASVADSPPDVIFLAPVRRLPSPGDLLEYGGNHFVFMRRGFCKLGSV